MYDETIEDTLSIGSDFRINDLDESLEVLFEGKWRRMTDNIEAIIELKMRMLGYGNKELKSANLTAMKQAWITRGHQQRYNPIKRFFESLAYSPSGNGLAIQPYYIPEWGRYIIDNPDGMFAPFMFRWMVGAVAKIYQHARNPMMVWAGGQEMGKSTMAEWLCSPLPDLFHRGPIKPDNKDERIRQAITFLWEVDELGSTTNRQDAEALKSFLTLNEITERPPFGKYPIRKPAVASFIGTVNPTGAGFLNDPTGTTRFLVTEINQIDFDYSRLLDPKQLWAEAFWFYRHIPDCWRLTADENLRRIEINAQYETTSALLDLIEAQFQITGEPGDFMTSWDIKHHLTTHNEYRITSEQAFYNELGRVMRQLGCGKTKLPHSQGGYRGYAGIKKREEN